MKPLTKILILLGLIGAIAGFLTYDAFNIAPKRYATRHETLSDEKIPQQLNDINILFFSDLEYGTFMNQERLDSLVNTINNISPDVIIFGGDLYDQDAIANADTNAILSQAFGSMKAPLGKYAVYGDNDRTSSNRAEAYAKIMMEADFEILNNNSITLRNKGSQSIYLTGLDNSLNGTTDTGTAYHNVSPEAYNITICHTPDTALEISSNLTDYFLAGHSHGGQAYFFFTAEYTPAYATDYLRGKHTIENAFTLDITNGVGTTQKDVRFLSDPEVVIYHLQSLAAEETPQSGLQTEPAPPASEEVQIEPESTEVTEETMPENTEEEVTEEEVPQEETEEEPQEESGDE
ncbi:MAG: metallophosphoesterase [Solobacterium sp.]|nr:metallophosphoesterase [Solobacterium sp.]